MKLLAPSCYGLAILMFCAALPASDDPSFQVSRMTRNDVPSGKGQCDIRVQVGGEVEVTVRGDRVTLRTIAGRDPRDDGSECNATLPNRAVQGFSFEVTEKRDEIRLMGEPSRANRFAAIVLIRNASGGQGSHHFRLSWALTGGLPRSRPNDDFNRPDGGQGFSWNNTVSFRGSGSGTTTTNNVGEMRLGEVTIEIDRGGKLLARFRTAGRGEPLSFTGQVQLNEGGRWKADVMSGDRRLRGPMWISVDERRAVTSVTLEATDGRDRMLLNWAAVSRR